MAKNITLLGASYSSVPGVQLPQTGGGTALFMDVTDTTSTAADVAIGKYFYTANGVRTQGSLTFSTIHTGSSAPSSSLGVNGDIYIQTG